MITQEDGPLTVLRNYWGLLENVYNRKTILHTNSHEHAWHKRKMKSHMDLVPIVKVTGCILRPLVGLRQEHAILEFPIDMLAQFLQKSVCFE